MQAYFALFYPADCTAEGEERPDEFLRSLPTVLIARGRIGIL